MDYICEENDVKEIIDDFIKFCDFIWTEKPFATSKGDLLVKACYDVNKILRYPDKSSKNTDRLYKYSSVSLWLYVAQEAGLIVCSESKGGKNIFSATELYGDFKNLNLFSQYFLIFYTWFRFVDMESQYPERSFDRMQKYLMDDIFKQLAKHGCEKWIEHDENKTSILASDNSPVNIIMGLYSYVGDTFNIFDLFETENEDDEKSNCEEYDKLMELIATGKESFAEPFLKCFPPDLIDTAAIAKIINGYDTTTADNRMFDFTVSLDKKCYRVIRCLPNHTFEDLHLAIQQAFEFDNDHLYSFYLNGKIYSDYAVNSPYFEEPPYADEVTLGETRLKQKQRMVYLFDYGDCWEFDVIADIKERERGVKANKKPEIIKTVGESPEQYPDYD